MSSLYVANEGLHVTYEQRLVPMGKLDNIVRLIDRNQLAIAQALTDEPAAIAREVDAAEKRAEEINRLWEAFVADSVAGMSPEEKELADKFGANSKKFTAEGLKFAVTALRANDVAQATAIMRGPMNGLFAAVGDSANKLMQFHEDTAKKEYEKNQAIYVWVRNSCISGMLFAVILGTVICIWLLRAIAQPLADAVGVAKAVAAGDLTRKIVVSSSDETGQLLQALKEMNESLMKIVSEVRGGTETIATASSQKGMALAFSAKRIANVRSGEQGEWEAF